MSLGTQISDILHERTNYDFVGNRKKWFAISSAFVLIGVIFLGLQGLNFGIDFKGGTAWEAQVQGIQASTTAAREAVEGAGLVEPAVQILGRDTVRVEAARATPELQEKIRGALAAYAHTEASDVSISDVGPTWGAEVSSKALRALLFFFIAIAGYLSFRFEPKMAFASLVAVLHDIVITVGAYAITGFQVTPATVIAFLTILGFSLYDTVVVFDKIEENVSGIGAAGKETYSAVVNRSMNEVLMRSLNTSIVAVLPVFSLLVVGSYIFGALTIRDFSLALFIGLLTGAYSSIFVATPVLAVLKEREPRYQAIRQRLASRAAAAPAPAPPEAAPVTPPAPEPDGEAAIPRVTAPSSTTPSSTAPSSTVSTGPRPAPARRPGPPPRPRQKRRKR